MNCCFMLSRLNQICSQEFPKMIYKFVIHDGGQQDGDEILENAFENVTGNQRFKFDQF